jgi:hypothetical protein
MAIERPAKSGGTHCGAHKAAQTPANSEESKYACDLTHLHLQQAGKGTVALELKYQRKGVL